MTDRRWGGRVPTSSVVLGYGPMLPLVAAAVGAWAGVWPALAVQWAIIWAALILAFVGGVRRGFGFGAAQASAPAEIAAAVIYVALAGAALVVPFATTALSILVAAYLLVAFLDGRAARRGNAPAHFARLRPPQMLIGAAALAATWWWLVH